MRDLEIGVMQGCDDAGHCARDTNGCGSGSWEGHSFDERIMAVTAIDYRGRVLTVVSQTEAARCSAQAVAELEFERIVSVRFSDALIPVFRPV